MPLSSYTVGAAVAVSDLARARDFYEGKLGLSAAADDTDGGRTYACSGGTEFISSSLQVMPGGPAQPPSSRRSPT